MLNNNPDVFSSDKRPIVEFAVENAKAVKLLSDRRDNRERKKKLHEQMGENEDYEANKENSKTNKKLRPWQKAMEERKRKRRLETRFILFKKQSISCIKNRT